MTRLLPFLLLAFLLPAVAMAEPIAPALATNDAPTTPPAPVNSFPQRPRIATADDKWVPLNDKVDIQDLKVGEGRTPQPHDVLHLHLRAIDRNGVVVNDSLSKRAMVRYAWKAGLMPEDFDNALATMRVGGKRVIRFKEQISYNLGYIPVYEDALPKQTAYWFEISLYRAEDLRKAAIPHFQ